MRCLFGYLDRNLHKRWEGGGADGSFRMWQNKIKADIELKVELIFTVHAALGEKNSSTRVNLNAATAKQVKNTSTAISCFSNAIGYRRYLF